MDALLAAIQLFNDRGSSNGRVLERPGRRNAVRGAVPAIADSRRGWLLPVPARQSGRRTRQLRKGLRKLAPYLPSCEGIDTARLHRDALAVLEKVERGMAVPVFPEIHTS
jgi:hypothetical protein